MSKKFVEWILTGDDQFFLNWFRGYLIRKNIAPINQGQLHPQQMLYLLGISPGSTMGAAEKEKIRNLQSAWNRHKKNHNTNGDKQISVILSKKANDAIKALCRDRHITLGGLLNEIILDYYNFNKSYIPFEKVSIKTLKAELQKIKIEHELLRKEFANKEQHLAQTIKSQNDEIATLNKKNTDLNHLLDISRKINAKTLIDGQPNELQNNSEISILDTDKSCHASIKEHLDAPSTNTNTDANNENCERIVEKSQDNSSDKIPDNLSMTNKLNATKPIALRKNKCNSTSVSVAIRKPRPSATEQTEENISTDNN